MAKQIKAVMSASGAVVVGGMEFPPGCDELTANLWMYGMSDEVLHGTTPAKRVGYLRRAIDLAFNCPGSIRRVVWNPWTDRIVEEFVGDWGKKRFLSIAGCSSSGKSDAVALCGFMEYWARPAETWFLVMSTTKDSARMRIWKSVTQFWQQAQRMGCPGKLNDSIGFLKGVNALGHIHGNSGIRLLAAGKQDADEACATLLGVKNPNIIVAADEFTELGDGILKTAHENMTSNDRLNFAGMANPNTLTDPFADLSEPEAGWKSVTEEDEAWQTKYGRCVRFNAEKSPRITQEDGERFHWQPDQAYCDRIAGQRGGKKSRGYYRFVKAFWCPDGATNSIYSEVEFLNSLALDDREPRWDEEPVTLTSLDPSFSRGGDRSSSAVGKVGKVEGVTRLHVCLEQDLEEDISNKTLPLSHQIVRQWKQLGDDWNIRPSRAIMDNTGSGISFGHIVDKEWSPAVSKVNFQSNASKATVKFRMEDCEYYNKNSELWIQPKEFIRGNQISGISKETMAELVEREFHAKEGRKLRVESKEEAKKRLKRSPDRADAFLLLVEKAILMGLLRSEEIKEVRKMADAGWMKLKKVKGVSTCYGRRMRR